MKSISTLLFKAIALLLLIPATQSVSAQGALEQQVKISDGALFFDGVRVPTSQRLTYPDNEKYDYAFGARITPHGDCIKAYGDYVFLTWYKGGEANRQVMLSRYNVKTETLVTIEFPHQHTGFHNRPHIGESHNTIAVGVCPLDNTVHLLYDMHAYSPSRPVDGSLSEDYFRYQFSVAGAAVLPDEEFTLDKFLPKRLFLKPGANYENLTYPAFFNNEDGEVLVRMREGGHNNSKYHFAKYDGTEWSDWSDFNVLNARSRGMEHNWGLYGDPKFLNGKLRIGFATRLGINDDRFSLNNGFHYAYSNDPSGAKDWFNYRNEPLPSPLIDYRPTKFAEPGDFVRARGANTVRMNSGADWIVTQREDLHFTNQVITDDERISVHTYKAADAEEFTTSLDFPSGQLYSEGNTVYLVNLENRYLTIYRAEGGTNDWTELYRGSGSDKRFRFGNVFIRDGKLYYFGMLMSSGSSQPIWLQVIDLGAEVVSSVEEELAAERPSVFPNPTDGGLQINSKSWRAETFTVFSIAGQQLLSGNVPASGTLQLDNLPPGVVLLRLTNHKGEVFTSKVVVR